MHLSSAVPISDYERQAGRLRVLFVTPRCYPDMGGIETHVYEVARRLAEQVESITVLATDRSGTLEPDMRVDGVRILRVPAYPRNRDYYFAPVLTQHIRSNQYDVIHVQGFHTFVPPLAMWAAGQARIPYVLTFHSGGHSSAMRNWIRPLQAKTMRPLMTNASRLIGVSKFEAEQFRQWLNLPASQFTVVQNGASLPSLPDNFQPNAHAANTILSIGRLERYKGHHRLIEAMPHILAQRPNLRLKILGLGEYESALRQQVDEMKLTHAVEITHVPPGERGRMAEEMASAGMVTLFSEYEAHPVAVMEAAALGCSILVADTSGLSEIAEHGLARAIPIDSTAQQIAQAVLHQLDHPHRPDLSALPSWERCTAELLDIYTQVVGIPAL